MHTEIGRSQLLQITIQLIRQKVKDESFFVAEASPLKYSDDVFSKMFVKSKVSHTGKGLSELLCIPT